MKTRTVVWEPVEYKGMEHLTLREEAQSVLVESVILGVEDTGAFKLFYVLRCDPEFNIRSIEIIVVDGTIHVLRSDGQGNWWNGMHEPLPQFAGCIDIDITATPFTNTLPIRRVAWEVGQSRDFNMLYVTVPELTLSVSEQRYTCLEKSESGGLFRFELRDGSFSADLPVDADGLVLDYPGLFKRLWAS